MSDYSIDLNGTRAVSVRLVSQWRGPWVAEVDIDPDADPVTASSVPTGQATITVQPPGGAPIVLVGTVDPKHGGRFASSVPVRVIGGYGWTQTIAAQDFASDSGVSSRTVESSVAAQIGETVVDASPVLLGTSWAVIAGPASSVFEGRAPRDWYVDPSGVTQVASRPSVAPDPSVQLLTWDPKGQYGVLAADALVLPGTQITDPRFDGPITVRDVVQTWSHEGTKVEIWCGVDPAPRLLTAFRNLVRHVGGIATLKRYRYRIVSQIPASIAGPSRLELQPLPNPDGSPTGAPNLKPVPVAPGMSGLSALFALSSTVTVAFPNGDPSQAQVESFDSTAIPQTLTLDASGSVAVGPSSSSVGILDATTPMAKLGDLVQTVVAGVHTVLPTPPGQIVLQQTAPTPGPPSTYTVLAGALTLQGLTPSSGTIVSGSAKLKGPAL